MFHVEDPRSEEHDEEVANEGDHDGDELFEGKDGDEEDGVEGLDDDEGGEGEGDEFAEERVEEAGEAYRTVKTTMMEAW